MFLCVRVCMTVRAFVCKCVRVVLLAMSEWRACKIGKACACACVRACIYAFIKLRYELTRLLL